MLGLVPTSPRLTRNFQLTLGFRFLFWRISMFQRFNLSLKKEIRHLISQGAPVIVSIIVGAIEIVRKLIRPVTLGVRLTANIISGHVLLELGRLLSSIFGVPSLLLLIILELIVAVIQAFVFSLLAFLYFSSYFSN